MARIILPHDSTLTKENLKGILTNHFGGKGYEVGYSNLLGADLYIKRTGWVGVNMKLKQKTNSTYIRINGYAPSTVVRMFFGGLLMVLILNSKWKALINEVEEFVASPKFFEAKKNTGLFL